MAAIALWASVAVAFAMLPWRISRNSGYFALAGSVMAVLYHYDIATVPGARTSALVLWAASLFLLASKIVPARHRRTA